MNYQDPTLAIVKPTPTPAWPADRREELRVLRQLVTEVRAINCSSGVLDRLLRCIELADKLDRLEFDTPRQSFLQFLAAEATKEKEP